MRQKIQLSSQNSSSMELTIHKFKENLDKVSMKSGVALFLYFTMYTSGALQGSILVPIMFQIYVNDMQCGVTRYVNQFADDTKLMKVVKSLDDCQELQGDTGKIYE